MKIKSLVSCPALHVYVYESNTLSLSRPCGRGSVLVPFINSGHTISGISKNLVKLIFKKL